MPEGIELKPTPDGYLRMAEMFRHEIIRNAEAGKAYTTIIQLRSLIEIAVYLSQSHPELYAQLLNPLKDGRS